MVDSFAGGELRLGRLPSERWATPMFEALHDKAGRCTLCGGSSKAGGCLCAPTLACRLEPARCAACRGLGGVRQKARAFLELFERCDACDGRGWIWIAPRLS